MSVTCIQDIYHCDTCKSALDEHGRNCRHGMLFPLLLLMGNFKKCMNYEFDAEKVELQLLRQSTPVSKTGMVLNKMERNKVWHITPSI